MKSNENPNELYNQLTTLKKEQENYEFSIEELRNKNTPVRQFFYAQMDSGVYQFCETSEDLKEYVLKSPYELSRIHAYSYYDEFAGKKGVIVEEITGEKPKARYLVSKNTYFKYDSKA